MKVKLRAERRYREAVSRVSLKEMRSDPGAPLSIT